MSGGHDILDDIEDWLKSLILGDFDEDAPISATVVGGLISLIPVVDQVMDVRDISGTLFNINRVGGFGKATLQQKVNLGFAAFGAIPELGSACKTVFKPLYKKPRIAEVAVQDGIVMVERLLHLQKGGAVRWVKALNWASYATTAVTQVNNALDSAIEMLTTLSEGHWWLPTSVQRLAAEALPGLKGMKGTIDAPIKEAIDEIRKFLTKLIGEDATAIALALAEAAALKAATAGATKSGSRAAPGSHMAPAATHSKVKSENRTNGKPRAGRVASVVERTATGALDKVGRHAMGIIGEHVVDYYCGEKLGWSSGWKTHDQGPLGSWTAEPGIVNKGKLSNRTKLFQLGPVPNASGIDAVWRVDANNAGKPYAIVEAKASEADDDKDSSSHSVAAKLGVTGIPKTVDLLDTEPPNVEEASNPPGKAKRPPRRRGTNASSRIPPPSSPVSPPTMGGKQIYVQMSHEWIEKNIVKAVGITVAKDVMKTGLANSKNYSRHLFYVPIWLPSSALHARAAGAALVNGERPDPAAHTDHDIQSALCHGEGDLRSAVNTKKANLRSKYKNQKFLDPE